MKCPFRKEVFYDYTKMNESLATLNHQKEDYPDCYESNCPLWKYDISEGGYYCIKAKLLQDSDEGDYCCEE